MVGEILDRDQADEVGVRVVKGQRLKEGSEKGCKSSMV